MTDSFIARRQWSSLNFSPISFVMSTLYINNLSHDLMKTRTGCFNGANNNHLFYADYPVLLSHSNKGLADVATYM